MEPQSWDSTEGILTLRDVIARALHTRPGDEQDCSIYNILHSAKIHYNLSPYFFKKKWPLSPSYQNVFLTLKLFSDYFTPTDHTSCTDRWALTEKAIQQTANYFAKTPNGVDPTWWISQKGTKGIRNEIAFYMAATTAPDITDSTPCWHAVALELWTAPHECGPLGLPCLPQFSQFNDVFYSSNFTK